MLAGEWERSNLFEELFRLREEMRRWKIDLRTGIDFRAVTEQASCGVCIGTAEGTIVYANAAFAERHGRTREECIGSPFDEFLPESHREESRRLFVSAARGAASGPARFLHTGRSSAVFPVISAYFPLPSPDDPVAYVVVMCLDLPAVSEQPPASARQEGRAESLLREAEAQGLLGFWELELETGRLTLSDHASLLVGRDPGLGPLTLSEARAQSREIDEAFGSLLAPGPQSMARIPRELSLEVPGKGTRWFQYTITTVRGEDGRPRRYFGILLDTTERRATDELVRDQAARLKRQAQELDQKNLALHEMMGRLSALESAMSDRTREILGSAVLPFLQQLRQSHNAGDRKVLERVEDTLRGLSLGAARPQKIPLSSLTRRELEICRMIRKGLSSKEISQELAISPQSVQTHRNHIRRKLGLLNGGLNLTVFLQSIDVGPESSST